MTTATAQIANHLNIAESVIASVEEWAHVLFVRFIGRRPRFVSKKVVEVKAMSIDEMMEEYLASCSSKDEWIDRVEAMESHLDDCLPGSSCASPSVLRSVAADVVDGKMTEQEAIARLTSRRPIIRKVA
jgi:hypothetical protein